MVYYTRSEVLQDEKSQKITCSVDNLDYLAPNIQDFLNNSRTIFLLIIKGKEPLKNYYFQKIYVY